MDEHRRSKAGPAIGTAAARDALAWIPCPTCWGQRRILEPDRTPGAGRRALVAQTCPRCLGVGEVMEGGALAPADESAATAEEPALPGQDPVAPLTWTVPRRTRVAIRAAAAIGCAFAAGAVAAFIAPPVAAGAIGALIGLYCHLSMGERTRV